MKEYEMIHIILNQCPGNHSRDQFIEEIECTDPETYLRGIFGYGKEIILEKTLRKDGELSFELYENGLHHQYIFTEI